MHIYLIVTEDETQAFVFSNLTEAKAKERELGKAYVFEWMKLWCRPLERLFIHNSYKGNM